MVLWMADWTRVVQDCIFMNSRELASMYVDYTSLMKSENVCTTLDYMLFWNVGFVIFHLVLVQNTVTLLFSVIKGELLFVDRFISLTV